MLNMYTNNIQKNRREDCHIHLTFLVKLNLLLLELFEIL